MQPLWIFRTNARIGQKQRDCLRRRERAMRWFRCLHRLQKFAAVHASAHIHFPTERHLQDRNADKQSRTAPSPSGAALSLSN